MNRQQVLLQTFTGLTEVAREFFPDTARRGDRASEQRDAVVFGLATVGGYEYIASKDRRVGLERNLYTQQVTVVRGDSDDILCLVRNVRGVVDDIIRRAG